MSTYTEWLDTVSEHLEEDFEELYLTDYQLSFVGSWLKAAFEAGRDCGKYGS
jgi:hypothetical protein